MQISQNATRARDASMKVVDQGIGQVVHGRDRAATGATVAPMEHLVTMTTFLTERQTKRSLPLDAWMTVETTPLTPHPSDPALKAL